LCDLLYRFCLLGFPFLYKRLLKLHRSIKMIFNRSLGWTGDNNDVRYTNFYQFFNNPLDYGFI